MTSDAPDILHRVDSALHGLAAALESGDPQAVLDAEVPLAAAVSELPRLTRAARPAHDTMARAVLATRLAVDRCVRLGHASGQLVAIVAGVPGYDPAGRRLRPVRTSTLTSRS